MPSLYREVKRTKERLVKKAKEKGLWENFGQKEISRIKEKFKYFDRLHSLNSIDKEVCQCIDSFENWCMNYDGGVM